MGILLIKQLFAFAALFHPFYISMTEIEYNKKESSLEISVRIFTNDLEASLKKTTAEKVDLMNVSKKKRSEIFLKNYLEKHIKLNTNGKNVNLNFVGFELKEGSVWSYLEVPDIPILKSLEIRNDILYESIDQQVNFIHVITPLQDFTEKLNYPDIIKRFIF